MTDSKSILIVRTDRLGDVLLTTPLGSALRRQLPGSRITWLVRPYTAPVLRDNPDVDDLLLDQGQSAADLARDIRSRAFDIAFLVYPRWRTTWAAFKAAIPVRIGPANKWYSLFLTHRVWQKRSQSAKHEADYNLDLLGAIGLKPERGPTIMPLTAAERDQARKTLEGYRISKERTLVVLHPGSGGSAARWPLSLFMRLGDRLAEAGAQVVVTAGEGETYQNVMVDQMRRPPVMIPAGSVTLRELGALFAEADLVVSNSTGPLHLAVAVGTKTVSIYSPIPACHPRRWGPYPDFVEGSGRHPVLIAPFGGAGQADMAAVSVDQVFEQCQEQLRKGDEAGAAPR